MRHVLKTWPSFFKALQSGEKTFELRKNDRDFKVGDTLLLQEFNPRAEPMQMWVLNYNLKGELMKDCRLEIIPEY